MASMDLEMIIRDLNKRFAAPLPEFYKRRIIFWYDEDREFEDKLEDIEIANAKLLVLTGTNNFAAKKLLNVDDTTSNYLVYSPITYESLEDDWLLNIELYSEEFRADLISIWMNEMELPATSDFRRLVKVYKKFFGAQPRRAAFTKLNKGITTASQMHLAVMAAICGATDMQPGSIVQAVIRGGTDMASNEVFQSLRSYGVEEPFWELVKQASGYNEGENASIERMITHILLTATTRTLRIEYLAGLDSFISTPHQAWCYDFVSEWIAEEEKPELTEILRNVEEELNLRKRFQQIPMEDLVRTEVFPCVNECILTHYEGILQVAKMQAFFLEHSAGFHTVEARKVWKEYTEDYYHMDTYYRQYHLAFGKSLTVGNDHLDDLFKQVTDKVEGLYTHWFLGELGNNWSDACADELAQYGRVLEVPQQVDFYGQIKDEDNRIFVIISDAFRYEVAVVACRSLQTACPRKQETGIRF